MMNTFLNYISLRIYNTLQKNKSLFTFIYKGERFEILTKFKLCKLGEFNSKLSEDKR